ncbi:uncharacterized protein LOC114033375 [Vombatus ursinus]|uniref:uncharacterized protein LOC114033375 n=1 Tax=Vombatus ursinus TaxID=29139 RepID=UPI000FFD21FA|nr:uncharacterized protein LOC114033375 [Vombatus ursinus]XP_027704678.1 uncharacterized protein LOC114033375 [Vombatus ursinus]XP_027704679.1 uncharacterized protein LOC114033375 [Vombatus ursinus]
MSVPLPGDGALPRFPSPVLPRGIDASLAGGGGGAQPSGVLPTACGSEAWGWLPLRAAAVPPTSLETPMKISRPGGLSRPSSFLHLVIGARVCCSQGPAGRALAGSGLHRLSQSVSVPRTTCAAGVREVPFGTRRTVLSFPFLMSLYKETARFLSSKPFIYCYALSGGFGRSRLELSGTPCLTRVMQSPRLTKVWGCCRDLVVKILRESFCFNIHQWLASLVYSLLRPFFWIGHKDHVPIKEKLGQSKRPSLFLKYLCSITISWLLSDR